MDLNPRAATTTSGAMGLSAKETGLQLRFALST